MRLFNAIKEGLLCDRSAGYHPNQYTEIPGAMMNLLVASIALGLIAFLGSQGVFQGMGEQTIRTLTYVSLGGVALFGLLYNVRYCCNQIQAYRYQSENRRWVDANNLLVPAVGQLGSALKPSAVTSQVLSMHSSATAAAEPAHGYGDANDGDSDRLTRSASAMPFSSHGMQSYQQLPGPVERNYNGGYHPRPKNVGRGQENV